ncbi:MAG: two-component system histidine kinase [Friedmanniella sp.]|nr:two-component system histidine kinase [Friedmanniella sp.]
MSAAPHPADDRTPPGRGFDPGPPLTPFGRGTLARQLVIRVTALVMLAAILLSGATALATRQLLMQQIDNQLQDVATRQRQGPPGGRGSERMGLVQVGNPEGTIFAAFTDDNSRSDSGILRTGGGRPPTLPTAAVTELQNLTLSDHPTSLELEGLGRYRVAVYEANIYLPDSDTTVSGRALVGIPLREVDHLLVQLIGLELILTLLAAGGAVLAARAVVAQSLRPLNRVAGTAQQVSQLPLDRGEVALAVRVPPADADPSTEVGRVGQALNHMLNNVEDALEARQASEVKVRQFVADASHELRNPLAAIRGYAELTRRSREPIPPEAAYVMSRVESEAERMSHLVEDLLLLARLDSGPALDIQPTDLTEIVIDAVSDARAAGPDHRWQLALPDEPVVALGDRHRLHQVIANLLANARTHTPAGTRVETAVAVCEGRALITVTDSGPGIPPEIASRVFERFTRADTSRVRAAGAPQGSSTGLGLAIVAAVVEGHHGRVTVESRPGRTQFSVRLPLAPVVPGSGVSLPVPDVNGRGPDMAPPTPR